MRSKFLAFDVTVKFRARKCWLLVAALLVPLAPLSLISKATARATPKNSGLEISYLGNEGCPDLRW